LKQYIVYGVPNNRTYASCPVQHNDYGYLTGNI